MSGNQNQSTNRLSSFVLLVIFLTLALSLVALIFGAAVLAGYYNLEGYQTFAYFLLALGIIGIALSAYVVAEARRRLSKLKVAISPVMTTVECKKCGVKNVREFQKGDYIFKETDPCQKCNDKMLITAIYKEVKEKEKEKERYTI